MKGPHRRWLMTAVLLVILITFVFFFMEQEQKAVGPVPVPVVKAATLTLKTEIRPVLREVTGTVAPVSYAVLSSKIMGLVEEIRVTEGNRVKKGDLLMRIDKRDLEAQKTKALAEFENASLHLNRMKSLFATESVAQQELDEAKRRYQISEAAVKVIESNLSYANVHAPFSGTITQKKIEVGELATPGRPLLVMEDDTKMRLEVMVSEKNIDFLDLGKKITVQVDALKGRRIEGEISLISPSADPGAHSFLVKIDLPTRTELKSGMFGRMFFQIAERETLSLPETAVIMQGDLGRVFVVDPQGRLQKRFVKFRYPSGGSLEILSGLDAGERILLEARKGFEGAKIQSPTENGMPE